MKKWLLRSLAVYVIAIAAIWLDGSLSTYEKSHYAVVLGNQVHTNGKPSLRLQARLRRALELYEEGTVKQIIVSGGFGKEGFEESLVMKNWLEAQGIPANDLIMDKGGYTTRKTANNAKQWAKAEEPIIVISQLYHISRAKLAFRQAGFEHVGAAYPLYFERRDIYASLRSVPAWIKYSLDYLK